MHIRIFLNTRFADTSFGYQPDQPVTEVYDYIDTTSATVTEALEHAFRLFNVGHDPEFGPVDQHATLYRSRNNRSLNKGDVVGCDGDFYACSTVGWDRVDPPTIVDEKSHGITPRSDRVGAPLRQEEGDQQ